MRPVSIKTEYINADCSLHFGRYMDGSIAIRLVDFNTGESLSVATVCMSGHGQKPAPENVFIKDYGENEGMLKGLQDAQIVGEPIRTLDAGFAIGGVHECKLMLDPNNDDRCQLL